MLDTNTIISRRTFVKGMLALPVAVALSTAAPQDAEAKVRKIVTGDERTPKVKLGKQAVTIKGNKGYLAFTAPKTKKYKFTFSNFKSKHSSSCKRKNYFSGGDLKQYDRQADIVFARWFDRGCSYPPYSVKTKGGTVKELHLGVNGANNEPGFMGAGVDLYGTKGKRKKNRIFKKRDGILKLKKGQTIYIQIYNTLHYELQSDGRDRMSFQLKIS